MTTVIRQLRWILLCARTKFSREMLLKVTYTIDVMAFSFLLYHYCFLMKEALFSLKKIVWDFHVRTLKIMWNVQKSNLKKNIQMDARACVCVCVC